MSLVRALTNKYKESPFGSNGHLGRATSGRNVKPVHRAQISGPIALVSSTNTLTHDAPDIVSRPSYASRNVSGSSSRSSGEESDASSISLNTTTDASSIDTSPIEPEPNHLSCYFRNASDTKSPTASMSEAPVVPSRVASHSKKAHEFIHRKRSVQRMMSPPSTRPSSSEMFSGYNNSVSEVSKETPFDNELAQLDEVQEELNHAVRDAETDADLYAMQSRGLATFAASDYMSEIQDLISLTFMAEAAPVAWI